MAGILSRSTATAVAYDAVAERYADYVRDELAQLPLDRAMLAAFAAEVGRVLREPREPREGERFRRA
jgi:hypothetical protein